MPIKLTKAQIKERDDFLECLAESGEVLKEALRLHCENRVNAAAWVENLAEMWRSEYDDKSERWQEGTKGESANAFIESWENWHADHCEDFEMGDDDVDAARDTLVELDETPPE